MKCGSPSRGPLRLRSVRLITTLPLAAQDGQTALHLAASNGHLACAAALMDKGCFKDATSNVRRQPALMRPPRSSPRHSLRLIIPPSFVVQDGQTALHLAALNGHFAMAAALVAEGCIKDATKKVRRPPLPRPLNSAAACST